MLPSNPSTPRRPAARGKSFAPRAPARCVAGCAALRKGSGVFPRDYPRATPLAAWRGGDPATRVICGAGGRIPAEGPQAAPPDGRAARPRPGNAGAKRFLAHTPAPAPFRRRPAPNFFHSAIAALRGVAPQVPPRLPRSPVRRKPFASRHSCPVGALRGAASPARACGPSCRKRPPAPQIARAGGGFRRPRSLRKGSGGVSTRLPQGTSAGCVAGCAAPRHARDLRRGRSDPSGGAASRAARRARGKAPTRQRRREAVPCAHPCTRALPPPPCTKLFPQCDCSASRRGTPGPAPATAVAGPAQAFCFAPLLPGRGLARGGFAGPRLRPLLPQTTARAANRARGRRLSPPAQPPQRPGGNRSRPAQDASRPASENRSRAGIGKRPQGYCMKRNAGLAPLSTLEAPATVPHGRTSQTLVWYGRPYWTPIYAFTTSPVSGSRTSPTRMRIASTVMAEAFESSGEERNEGVDRRLGDGEGEGSSPPSASRVKVIVRRW